MFSFFRTTAAPVSMTIAANRLRAQADFPNDISLTGQRLAYLPLAQATQVAGLTSAEWHARDAERAAAIIAQEAASTVAAAYRSTPLRSRQAALYAKAEADSHAAIAHRRFAYGEGAICTNCGAAFTAHCTKEMICPAAYHGSR